MYQQIDIYQLHNNLTSRVQHLAEAPIMYQQNGI